MICKECLPLLEAHLDGELDGRTAEHLRGHLNDCASCTSAYAELRREQDFYLSYECDATPAPSFWANVSTQVKEEQSTRDANSLAGLRQRLSTMFGVFNAPRLSWALTILLVASAVGLTVLVMRDKNLTKQASERAAVSPNGEVGARPTSPKVNEVGATPPRIANNEGVNQATEEKGNPRRRSAIDDRSESNGTAFVPAAEKPTRRQSPGTRHTPTTDQLVREAEQKYVAAIALLSRDVSRRRSRLDAETVAQFKQTLAAIDRTIAGTRRAVREHPEDPVAVQYMLTAYAKKVEVMREMVNQ